jgi:hypothetical protein
MEQQGIHEIFARQRGLITREQAREHLIDRSIEHRLESRTWSTVHPEVFRHGAFPVTHEQLLLAAVLASGPDSAVSHRAALDFHGLRGFASRLIEVSRPTLVDQPMVGVRLHRSSDLSPQWITTHDGLPVTTPVRTLVDLGVVRPGVVRWCREWLSDRVVAIQDLQALDAWVEEAIGRRRLASRSRSGVGRLLPGRAEVLRRVLLAQGCQPVFHHLLRSTEMPSRRRYPEQGGHRGRRLASTSAANRFGAIAAGRTS